MSMRTVGASLSASSPASIRVETELESFAIVVADHLRTDPRHRRESVRCEVVEEAVQIGPVARLVLIESLPGSVA